MQIHNVWINNLLIEYQYVLTVFASGTIQFSLSEA
jgi:hypothetical protein